MTQSDSGKSDEEVFEVLRQGLLAQPASAKRDESLRMVEALGPSGVAAMMKMKQAQKEAEAARPRIEDPVFGTLFEEQFCWEGEVDDPGVKQLLAAGKKVPLDVWRGKTSQLPTDQQRQAYRALVDAIAVVDLQRVIQQANFEYYENVKESYRDAIGDEEEADEFVPHAVTPTSVMALLSRPRIRVPEQSLPPRRIVIEWECTWDPEHGHQVELQDEQVQYVGMQR